MGNAVRLLGSVIDHGPHGHNLCLDLMSCHVNRSLSATKKNSKHITVDMEREKDKVSKVLEMEDQAPLYISNTLGSTIVILVKEITFTGRLWR